MTTMSSMLRMAIFGGAVALSPALALADTWAEPVPDHATAEAHRGEQATDTVPDHATAERDDARAADRPERCRVVRLHARSRDRRGARRSALAHHPTARRVLAGFESTAGD